MSAHLPNEHQHPVFAKTCKSDAAVRHIWWGVRTFSQIEKSESLKTYHAYEIYAHEVHTQ
jgi:hypothetical protein